MCRRMFMPFLTACGIKEPHTSFTKSERLPWESINCVFCWSNFRKSSNWFTSFKRVSEFRCISSTLLYDKASGKLTLDSQSISPASSSSYYFACAAGVEGYAHTELSLPSRLRSGLVNVTVKTNPFTFYFADKASQENTSLIIWAYSSDEYSTSGLMGYWSWYNSILMVKENEGN